jgi:hypothetical protein
LTRGPALGSFLAGIETGRALNDAFARDLVGDACEAPADALDLLRPLLASIAFCTRERPWGIHADLTGRCCPRCGWTPARRRRRS